MVALLVRLVDLSLVLLVCGGQLNQLTLIDVRILTVRGVIVVRAQLHAIVHYLAGRNGTVGTLRVFCNVLINQTLLALLFC